MIQEKQCCLKERLIYTPKTQVFSAEELEGEPEKRTYWCAVCKGELTYLDKTDTIWECENCVSYCDTKIQDTPVKDKSGFKIHSYHDPYQQYDEESPNLPFVEGIDIDKQDQEEVELIRSSEDIRVQHLRVTGSPADAISQLISKKRKVK